ncbi:hypothetical protein Taro_048159 [Colocasia esculenta]|uniref:RNase H type-1 domain-containing protein n=1 Tax=Colocasia esculenta TaxID=4460 RepID=A0A843X277_COLES|nr:hypothetical protein [Colocasia esculenta]
MKAILELGFSVNVPFKMCKMVRWILPLQGLMLNVDGASKGNPGPCGDGGLFKNPHGTVSLAFSHFYGLGYVRWWLLAIKQGLMITEIWSDPLSLVNPLHTGVAPSWDYYRWWRDVHDFVQQHGVRVSHVYREANQVADALANYACLMHCNEVFNSSRQLPRPCFPSLIGDRMGLRSFRSP